MTGWCVDLPMTEICPATYSVSPTTIHCLLPKDLSKVKVKEESCLVVIDCLKFCRDISDIVFSLYEQVGAL
jgi:hypothetical protein